MKNDSQSWLSLWMRICTSAFFYISIKFPAHLRDMIAGFTGLASRISLAHIHVALERCELEGAVRELQSTIPDRASVVVATVGSLLREASFREIGVAPERRLFLLAIDEATRTSKFEVDMLALSLRRWIGSVSHVGVVGDPTQTPNSVSLLPSTESMCGATSMRQSWS